MVYSCILNHTILVERNYVALRSIRRLDEVDTTSWPHIDACTAVQCHFDVICPLGMYLIICPLDFGARCGTDVFDEQHLTQRKV